LNGIAETMGKKTRNTRKRERERGKTDCVKKILKESY